MNNKLLAALIEGAGKSAETALKRAHAKKGDDELLLAWVAAIDRWMNAPCNRRLADAAVGLHAELLRRGLALPPSAEPQVQRLKDAVRASRAVPETAEPFDDRRTIH